MSYARVAAALAVSALGAAGEASAADSVVGELIVTAQRREQSAVDVPIALSAYASETLEALRVRSLHDVAAITPGLLVQDKSPIDSRFVLRGIGSDDGSSYQEARVSVFQDGAPISKSRGAYVELFDLERVEVARGPQTTLYGRSALIGAINIIQKKAEPGASDLRLHSEAGDYAYGLVEGAATLSPNDQFALRAAARYRTRNGTVDNLLNGEDFGAFEAAAGRLSLAFAPSDAFRADLILNHQHDEGSGQSYKSRTFNPSDPATGTRLGDTDPDHGAALFVPDDFVGGPMGFERDLTSLTGLASWDVSSTAQLTFTGAYRVFDSRQALDYDGFAFPLLSVGDDVEGEQQSYDLRLNFEPREDLTFVGGLSYFKETGEQRTPFQINEPLVLALLTGALDRRNPDLRALSSYTAPALQAQLLQGLVRSVGGALPTAHALAVAANLNASHTEVYTDFARNEAVDLYGDLTWKPVDRVTLSAGLRYGYTEKRTAISSSLDSRSVLAGVLGSLRQSPAARTALLGALSLPGAAQRPTSGAYPIPMFGLRAQPTAGNGGVEGAELTDRGAAWRLTAQYEVTPLANLYATYARGRRPEVLSPNTPASPGGAATFDRVAAETVDSVELGFKWRDRDRRLTLDAAVYAYDYSHFQTIVQQGTQFVTADAGEAQSLGLELQGSWAITPGTELFATYAWSRARFEDGLYEGNRLALSPGHSLTLGVDLAQPLFGGTLRLLPTYSYVSEIYFTDTNGKPELATNVFVAPLSFEASQEGYGVLDLRASFTPGDGPWTAGVFVNNALNTSYVKEAGNGGEAFGLPTYIAGNPRMVGVSLTFRP